MCLFVIFVVYFYFYHLFCIFLVVFIVKSFERKIHNNQFCCLYYIFFLYIYLYILCYVYLNVGCQTDDKKGGAVVWIALFGSVRFKIKILYSVWKMVCKKRDVMLKFKQCESFNRTIFFSWCCVCNAHLSKYNFCLVCYLVFVYVNSLFSMKDLRRVLCLELLLYEVYIKKIFFCHLKLFFIFSCLCLD